MRLPSFTAFMLLMSGLMGALIAIKYVAVVAAPFGFAFGALAMALAEGAATV